MRYPAEHKQQTRERIVRAAARRFRSRGSEGTVIGDLMRDLRLTHGGFYRHFDSKEELFAEALEQSLKQLSAKALSAIENAPPGGELKALIDRYLDVGHCENVAGGCPVAALATEIARRPPNARTAFLRVLKNHMARVAKYIPGATEEEREHKARVLFSGMAGTLTLARVIVDDHQRRRFLDDAKKFYFDAVRQ
ncbi:MAG TPA: TetR/AcrR family transcriptional regulator [Candidatus Acidoferrales bacterium]|nr:TetR/AcrR family transcriptional regulator [Candidatus Acidoferrales bacterium]